MTAKATSRPASASHEAPFSFRWFLRVCTKEFAARVTVQRILALAPSACTTYGWISLHPSDEGVFSNSVSYSVAPQLAPAVRHTAFTHGFAKHCGYCSLVERRRITSMPAASEDLTQIWFIGFGPAALGCPRSRPEFEIWQQHNYLCEEQCLKTVAEERWFFSACF